ncbi:MAG: hypothetical protein CVV14_03720 [Gammaproteobacteria bacterium HGW-Gammaproteobacteria-4]|jgi:uncharacterized membrane protein YgcG|nr:MAG: hypothetical protein CVV14_03720 [Gammaproteobacteria bacterium HGW-Gammaproteobacteria-4]
MSGALRQLLACALLLAASAAPAQSDERIRNYAIEVDVRADGTLDVTERITVHATGNRIRRGIYRDFPTRYRDRYGNAVVVDFTMLSMLRDDRVEPWFIEHLDNGVRINAGDDRLLPQLPGDYRYVLRYRTTRQLGFFAAHDELYWNAIGTGWVFPIDTAQVTVRLPAPVPIAEMKAEGYTGAQGAKGSAYRVTVSEPGVAQWQLTAPLAAREGLTIVLGFPKGLIPAPGATQRLGWLLQDNRGLLLALAGWALLLTFCIRRWRQVGRDPRAGVIIARYEPPADRAPAELRYLRRRRYDTRCFTSDLLSAAVDGKVAIERKDRMLRKDQWSLRRLDIGSPLMRFPTPSALLTELFPASMRTLVLEDGNASHLQRAQRAHAKALNQRLHGSHFKRNTGSLLIAFGIAAASAVLAFVAAAGNGVPAIIAVCVLMVVTLLVFAYLVQAPTHTGRKLLDEIEGLKLYLSVAERDELTRIQGPGAPPPLDAKRYETLLPYAIALDVEEAWTDKFTRAVGAAAAAAATASIAWYHGASFNDMGSLANAVGSSLSSSIASASTPPGTSSGGGGGGSSGGGGGGGGGGGR